MSLETCPVVDFFTTLERHAWHGNRPALTGSQETWSYARLLQEVTARAAWLREHEIRRLALDLPNGPELLAWDLAALRAGLPCIILPDFFSPAQRAHALQDCGADLLLGTPERAAEWAAAGFSEGPHGWQRPAAA
ncbi:AMP-binding protein, partial [Pseudomonas oryzihabitans]|uniref:AMP-binding protein n=1 Tax=Pseudomonas oryzihabitans TaxID=47885 RepID=UPI00241D4341